MTHFTYGQLEGLWKQAGGNPVMAPLMAAIAEVESSGNSDAENPSGATGLWQMEWPLYANFVPGATSRAAYLDPMTNARAAVKLSQNNPSVSPGSPVYDNWIKWEFPAGAYKSFLQGNVPATTVSNTGSSGGGNSGSSGSGGGGGGAPSAPFIPVITPLEHIPWLGHVISGFFNTAGGVVGDIPQVGSTIGDVATAIGSAVGEIGTFMKWISWLFVPAHWLRIGAFFAGLLFMAGGIYMFKEAL